MANWSTLKAAIANAIKTNGNQEITGQLLQNVLNNIVSSVGENSTFAGIATPSTNPGTPDGPVFYFASEPGVYANFGGIEIADGEAVILEWRGSWVKKVTGFATQEKFVELENNTSIIDNKVSTAFPNIKKNNYDFVLCDDKGNIVLCVKNGYVISQNFNSEKLFTNLPVDYAVQDNAGNIVFEVIGGHIKTKNFNSSKYPFPISGGSHIDFSIQDKNGNDILRISNGHIKTKNFNSSKYPFPISGGSHIDFSIQDKNGNDILRISNGHIKTKNFNSSNLPDNTIDKFKGKKISFVGDSITTFRDWIPEGYAPWYPNTNSGITTVEKTWWYQLVNELGATLLKNCSWSGSRITGDTASNDSAQSAASNKRIADCADGDITPDIVICYIGINDYFHPEAAQLGSFDETSTIPADGTISIFADAYAIMVNKLLKTYPQSKVFCCTLMDVGSNGTYPVKNSQGTISQYNDIIKKIATCLGAEIIDAHACGINYSSTSLYLTDGTHPNSAGAIKLKNKVKADLIAKY